MASHFLLSAKARTLPLKAIFRMSDDEAHDAFVAIRFSDNGGAAFCPPCECTAVYTYAARRIWKCKACSHQFSVTSGTIFASRKLAIRDLLAATAIFVNAVKGISALQLGRDLDVQYKTAFVLAHKMREALGSVQNVGTLAGVVEIDGAYFGGHAKQENEKADRKDRRLTAERTGKRQSVIVARERDGRTLTTVVAKEAQGVAFVRSVVEMGGYRPCRRSGGLGRAAWPLRDAPHQPLGSVQQGRRVHQSGGVVFLPATPRRSRTAPPHQRQVSGSLRGRDGLAGG